LRRRRHREVRTGFDPPRSNERLEAEWVKAEVKAEMERKICIYRPTRCQGYANACGCRECEFRDLFSRVPVAA